MQAPGDTESSNAIDVRATVGDVVHDENTPGDGPLLSADDTATGGWGSKLGDIDGDLSRANTNSIAVDETADNKHANVLGSTRNDGADAPSQLVLASFVCMYPWMDELVAYQKMQPIMIAFFRPSLSERKPEEIAPRKEPPGMAAVIPP